MKRKKKQSDETTLTYGGVKISFTKSKTDAAVRYIPGAEPASKSSRSVSAPVADGFHLVKTKRGIETKLDKLRSQSNVSAGTHVYNVGGDNDVPLIPTGKLYIEFYTDSGEDEQHEIFEELGLSIIEKVHPGAYRVCISPSSGNPLKVAAILQSKKIVAVAEPEFATFPAERAFSAPKGVFSPTQWHHENTGSAIPIVDDPTSLFDASQFKKGADAKVKAAWEHLQSLGSNTIRIAVIDTGFDTDHPSLYGNGDKVKNPYNAKLRNTDVSPYYTYSDGTTVVFAHGTSCAAVAAGYLYDGILGAAPNAKIIPIKLDILSDEAIKSAFEHALLNGVHIISCSLGYPKAMPLSTYITNYLTYVINNGRAGKGMPMFFAAGNANPASNNVPREISDFAAHPGGVCVTACNSLDEASSYSFYGKNAYICAPTNGNRGVGITTASCQLNDNGALEHVFTADFGGTSSATPLVAGICALMLSVNNNLTISQIKQILRTSTDKIGSGYDGNGHSTRLGYGKINALKAVKAAQALMGSTGGTSSTGNTTTSAGTSTNSGNSSSSSTRAKAKVASATLNVRKGPATTFAKVATLKKGDVVELFEKQNDWYMIGTGKYVHGDYLTLLPATQPATGTGGSSGSTGSGTSTPKPPPATAVRQGKVTSEYLNIRSGPGTWYQLAGKLLYNQVADIYEIRTDGWYRIGTDKWVLGAKYIRLV